MIALLTSPQHNRPLTNLDRPFPSTKPIALSKNDRSSPMKNDRTLTNLDRTLQPTKNDRPFPSTNARLPKKIAPHHYKTDHPLTLSTKLIALPHLQLIAILTSPTWSRPFRSHKPIAPHHHKKWSPFPIYKNDRTLQISQTAITVYQARYIFISLSRLLNNIFPHITLITGNPPMPSPVVSI